MIQFAAPISSRVHFVCVEKSCKISNISMSLYSDKSSSKRSLFVYYFGKNFVASLEIVGIFSALAKKEEQGRKS